MPLLLRRTHSTPRNAAFARLELGLWTKPLKTYLQAVEKYPVSRRAKWRRNLSWVQDLFQLVQIVHLTHRNDRVCEYIGTRQR
jgi:hypothetical protein